MTCKAGLFFILGKGGVGKSSLSLALARSLVKQGKKILLVQWTFEDQMAKILNKSHLKIGHQVVELEPSLWCMNYSSSQAIREYVVDHLGYHKIYKWVVQNPQIQSLIKSAPGIQELTFMGRLYWLSQLQEEKKGWCYDLIIVDTPSTGHGLSLFELPLTIAQTPLAGPLAKECARVSEFLRTASKTQYAIVTLPEILPVTESKELFEKMNNILGYKALYIFLNKMWPENLKNIKNIALEQKYKDSLKNKIEIDRYFFDVTKYIFNDYGFVNKNESFIDFMTNSILNNEVPLCL